MAIQRQGPTINTVQKTVEVLQIQFFDRVVDMPVDGHMDYSCDSIPDFQMEVVSKEKVCGIIDDCELNACRTGDCVDKVNGYMCDCDKDPELMLQVNDSACVARNVKISFPNMVQWNRRGCEYKVW